MSPRRIRHFLGILLAATVTTLAFSGCSPDPDRTTALDAARAEAASPSTTAPKPAKAEWRSVTAPSTCRCSDGSEFRYWVREANPTKVLFFLQGGGACFSAGTCGPGSETYTRNLDGDLGPTESDASGIFDLADKRNPFRDYSMVFVPYCTGDVHLGNAVHDYGDGVVIHHSGYINAGTALAATAAMFPKVKQLAVVGASAGSAGAPLYAGLAADVMPDAKIRVLADSSGAYPATPGITAAIGSLWGTTNAIPPWSNNAGMTAERWTLPGLFVQSGNHDPDIVFGRFDYAYDDVQADFAALAGIPADDLVTLIDDNERLVEDGGVDLHTWVQPGVRHTIVGDPDFYTTELEGKKLVDWVAALMDGDDVPDVHCTDCERPTA